MPTEPRIFRPQYQWMPAGTKYEFHPASEDYPLHTDKDRVADMKANGFDPHFPIAVLNGLIVGGRGRYIDAGTAVVEFCVTNLPPDTDPYQFAERENERRRHDTKEEIERRRQRRVERIASAREQGKSTREIAEQEKVSQSQVVSDLKVATEQGVFSAPKKVTGKDGRKQPATKPKILCSRCQRIGTPVKDCAGCKEARATKKKVAVLAREPGDDSDAEGEVKDADGYEVPAKALPAFSAAKELAAICREIDGIIHRVEEMAKALGGRLIRFESFQQMMKDAKGNLWANRATHVCPYCHGKKDKCECCKGEGWTAKHIWQQAPSINGKK